MGPFGYVVMANDFGEGIDELIQRLDGGDELTGSVEFDQVYAHIQHEALDFKHPRGGQAKYLETPLFESAAEIMQKTAGSFLEDGGREGMSDAMELLADKAEALAPVEFHDLRDSAHPKVTAGEEVVYDRQPRVPRLTEDQLKAKNRLRDLGYGGIA